MVEAAQKRIIKLRAAGLVLMLALGWLSGPAALAARSSDVCSMACCVEEGHCCCKPARPFVEGQLPDGGDRIEKVIAIARCPEGCATLGSSSFSLRTATGDYIHNLDLLDSIVIIPRQVIIAHNGFQSGPASPRGPPLLSLNLTA